MHFKRIEKKIYKLYIYPLASFLQYGAYNPVKAGTKYTSPVLKTLCAKCSLSCTSFMSFILSRNHLIAAPATAIEPSNA